jgi:hypothetical protein
VTPRAIRAQTRVLGLALLLALASFQARGGELYSWVTEDGRIEVGAKPPPGVSARPWSPGQESAAQPAKPAAPAAAVEATPAAPQRPRARRTREADRRAGSRRDDKCLARELTIEKATQKTRILESQIARLEKRLEELEATELAYSRTSCRTADFEGPTASDCVTSSFHRDAEISSTQEALENAQQRLGDLEQRARTASEDQSCAPAAAQK